MKYIISLASVLILLLVFSASSFAQQYEDVIYLKSGSIFYGIITEQVLGDYVKIKTNDGKLLVFKVTEIEKMTKQEITVKKEKNDSIKTKNVKITETDKKKEKELIAKNSITIQPIGLLTLLTNIEYDRALGGSISMGLKISFMTFFARDMISFEGDKKDVDKAESMKKSISAWGIGSHFRLYPGAKAIEGFFLGLAVEKLSLGYDEVKYDSNNVKTTKSFSPGLVRLEFEIGAKSKLSSNVGGFTISWSLGAGVGFVSGIGDKGDESSTVPLGSFGFGLGYSF